MSHQDCSLAASNETVGFSFPVGYEAFHEDQLFNFQLNRPYSLGYARREDLEEAGKRIGSFSDWRAEMHRQAERALAEDRLVNAAYYVRGIEIYTFPDDPDKETLYDRFVELFEGAFSDQGIRRVQIPYDGAWLPAMVVEPVSAALGAGWSDAGGGSSRTGAELSGAGAPLVGARGTILLHGGYDSFIEELYSLMRYFAAFGYRVIGFEGPGQGAARRKAGLPLDYRWERPVAAVLDHLELPDVTLIGLSMGGYFALRAAAFEPRVKRVIASGHAYDYRRVSRGTSLLEFFRDHLREFTNRLSRWKIRQGGMEAWNISHLMYVLDEDEPMAALDFAFSMNEKNLHSDRVTQDVLLLASREDHFIPFRLHREQLKRLPAARSVTDRVFTREDQAHNHCQIGNIGLALRVMQEWLESPVSEDQP